MTQDQFVSWLKGFLDAKPEGLSAKEVNLIKDEISKVSVPLYIAPDGNTPYIGQPYEPYKNPYNNPGTAPYNPIFHTTNISDTYNNGYSSKKVLND
jgi:hypothetical protein